MGIWVEIMVFVLGMCCGSFVNMLVYRTAIDYGLLKVKKNPKYYDVKNSKSFFKSLSGRSFCDYCGKQLGWYENIPVISWIIQKGEARCCRKKLSPLYPIVEITTGLLFLIFNLKFLTHLLDGQVFNQIQNLDFQMAVQILVSFTIIIFLVFSAVFDLKYMILPDFSTIILILSAVVLILMGATNNLLLDSVIAAGLSFLFLGFLYLVTKGKGMGLGDVKLAVFMGLFLGQRVIAAFYIAFIVGALWGLILITTKKAGRKTLLPFGPFLLLGTFIVWIFEKQIDDLLFLIFVR